VEKAALLWSAPGGTLASPRHCMEVLFVVVKIIGSPVKVDSLQVWLWPSRSSECDFDHYRVVAFGNAR